MEVITPAKDGTREVPMKYTKEQRIDIGRQVYTHEISHAEAEKKYGVVKSCIDNYIQDYKIANGIPTGTRSVPCENPVFMKRESPQLDIEAYKSMSKEELIDELIRAKVNEARAKKGYEVKGDGAGKEFISLNNRNSKS
jgi:transposase